MATEKKRVLIPIVGQGSITHIIRSGILTQLKAFCNPIILLLWEQDDLIYQLESEGYEVFIMPKYSVSANYTKIRGKINYWYQHFRLKSSSTKIQSNFNKKISQGQFNIKSILKKRLLWLSFRINPFYIKRLIALEESIIKEEQIYQKYNEWIDNLRGQGIFTVTPFLHEVELVARLLKRKNGLLMSSIHSFDNITKRGWPAIFFDEYFVWNKYNKSELERINPDFKTENIIKITGAPQFDFHFDEAFCWSKQEWLKKLSLPEGKKIVLYAGGAANILPKEPQYLKHLVTAIEEDGNSSDVIILFRCHPLDKVTRWKENIGEAPFLYYDYKIPVDRKLDYNNFSIDEIRMLVSTLKYTDVHISVCSTMTIDGSVFNKPQIAPYYDEESEASEILLREIYHQEHYLPIVNSGVLNFAYNKQELFEIVTKALSSPNSFNKNCKLCLKETITFTDGRSSERVISQIKKIITK